MNGTMFSNVRQWPENVGIIYFSFQINCYLISYSIYQFPIPKYFLEHCYFDAYHFFYAACYTFFIGFFDDTQNFRVQFYMPPNFFEYIPPAAVSFELHQKILHVYQKYIFTDSLSAAALFTLSNIS